ncbi:hypothetical protein HpCK64_14990 [Helicobacter pylori]
MRYNELILYFKEINMPNTTNKDYTKYSQRQLFNLMNKKEQEIEKLKRDRVYLEKKMVKELEKKIKVSLSS